MSAVAPHAPWTQTASGRALPLAAPVPAGLIDIRRDVAAPLGHAGRFANQLPSGALYSVAQHCVLGADWIASKYCDLRAALAFLLHDAHEALLGDQTEPFIAALHAAFVAELAGIGVDLAGLPLARLARKRLTDPIDAAIHAEAGLDWPLDAQTARLVHLVDRRLLMTERAHLLCPPPLRWDEALERLEPLDLKARIRPMQPVRAAEAWIARFELWSARLRERAPARPAASPAERSSA